MNNIVVERIRVQFEKVATSDTQQISTETVSLSPPISPEKLKELLFNLIKEPPQPQVIQIENDEVKFENIYEFVAWYLTNKDKFSEQQQKALETLVSARRSIEEGCGCRRAGRQSGAFAYFRIFWENNLNNDLLPTLLKVTNAKKINIGNFVLYPS